jgi:hypothetical protein
MATPLRGLTSIRTLAGRVNQTFSPYRAYMQITCLEMEKSRRLEEHRAASVRIAAINARLADIERQKQGLEQGLQDAGACTLRGGQDASVADKPGRVHSSPPRASRVGLKLKY